MTREVRFGTGKGAIFPHQKAGMLLNSLRRFVHSAPKLADRLELTPDALLLEIGPGPGYFSIEFARRVPRGRHVLFDIQSEMLAMARSRQGTAGVTPSPAVQGDALRLPFADASFDAAVLVAVLGEIPGPGDCLQEVRRVLRPGGLLCVSETRGDPDRIRYDELRRLAEGAGFVADAGHPGRGWSYTAKFRAPG
ncbi:MAG: class I SAM-dependent methyltransferase [Dehalococcoidia bacterium]|nr:methyltransferase domain-containing protein [Dehalococcoidia bacterium]